MDDTAYYRTFLDRCSDLLRVSGRIKAAQQQRDTSPIPLEAVLAGKEVCSLVAAANATIEQITHLYDDLEKAWEARTKNVGPLGRLKIVGERKAAYEAFRLALQELQDGLPEDAKIHIPSAAEALGLEEQTEEQ